MKGMADLKEWWEVHAGTYDPAKVIVELGNPIPEMTIQDIQLMNCYWYIDPEAEDEEAKKAVSESVTFQYEESKMVGKKHRIRTYSIDEINGALKDAGILPVSPRTEEFAQLDSDVIVEPEVET